MSINLQGKVAGVTNPSNARTLATGFSVMVNYNRISSIARCSRILACAFGILAVTITALAKQQTDVAKTAAEAVPLKVGTVAPNSQLLTLEGKSRSLKEVLGGKPTVLIFYRGGWCPFCNRQLADMETVEAKIRGLGFQIVAITPDRPSELVKTMDKHQLTYQLYSDSKADAIKNFGIAWRVDDPTFLTMRDSYKVDLEASSGQTHHILPVPSVFIIDRGGKIVYVHSNPDFKVRMAGSDLLAVAKRLAITSS
jgi:peroxiredoxin